METAIAIGLRIFDIVLLLKNLDPEWKNDDQTTIDMKKKQLELTERKIDQNEW